MLVSHAHELRREDEIVWRLLRHRQGKELVGVHADDLTWIAIADCGYRINERGLLRECWLYGLVRWYGDPMKLKRHTSHR
jgi:hypothetical protein